MKKSIAVIIIIALIAAGLVAVGEVANLITLAGRPSLGEKSDLTNGVWRQAASGGTGSRTVVDIAVPGLGGVSQGIRIADDGTSKKTSDIAMDAVDLNVGEYYVLSCYAKGSGTLRIQTGKKPYKAVYFDVDDEWRQYSLAFRADAGIGMSDDEQYTNLYFGLKAKTEGDITLCGFQLELVTSHAWCGEGD